MELTRKQIIIVFLMSFIYCVFSLRNIIKDDAILLIKLSFQMQVLGFFGGMTTTWGMIFGGYIVNKFLKKDKM